MAYTAQYLIDTVRLRGMLPNAVVLGTQDADILNHANYEMENTVVPMVLSVSEEFYVATVDIPLVANQTQYRIPNNNVGGRVRNVALLQGDVLTPLARLEPERLAAYTVNAIGAPRAFFMDGGNINLVPGPSSAGGALRVKYYMRPGQLSNTASDYVKLSGVSYNSAKTILTFGAGGGGGTLVPVAGQAYDFIANRSPFETQVQVGTIAAGFTLTMSTNLPQTIANGDYICNPDTSPVMQVPVEAQSYLVQRTLCSVLEQLGDNAKLEPALARAEKLKEATMMALSPRTDGNPQKMRGLIPGYGWWGFGVR